MGIFAGGESNTMNKPHIVFKKIIAYCKLMGYNVNDILNMSDYELKLWYDRVTDLTQNEIDFRIKTGRSLRDESLSIN